MRISLNLMENNVIVRENTFVKNSKKYRYNKREKHLSIIYNVKKTLTFIDIFMKHHHS